MAANDTEENTRWIEVWVLNDIEYYGEALEKAKEGADVLRDYLTKVLQNAPKDSVAYTTAKEMRGSDYDKVDWAEVAETLTAE